MFTAFKLGYMCRITVIFGTLKDGSLLINILASNNCFSYRNIFQNGVNTLSKIGNTFLSKSSKLQLARTPVKELQMEFQTSDVIICNGNMKCPIGISTFRTDFYVQVFSCSHCYC